MTHRRKHSPALSGVRQALAGGDLASAVAGFLLELGLSGSEKPAAASPGAAEIKSLLRVLEAPSPGEVSWWEIVAARWMAAGQPGVARSCIERARRMIHDGSPVSWPDLHRLAALERDVTKHALRKLPPRLTSVLQLPTESHLEKFRRIRRLFGFEEGRAREVLIHELVAKNELLSLVLAATSPGRGELDRIAWTYAWCRAGEHRIALEEFLGLIRHEPLASWLPSVQELMVECGRALRHLGDQVTAFACFQLVTWLNPPGESAPAAARDAGGPSLIQTAHGYVRDLAWAEALLGSGEHSFRISVGGPRFGQWMLERNLGGRYVNYLRQQAGAALLYPAATLERQVRSLGERLGWFLPALQMPAAERVLPAPAQASGPPPPRRLDARSGPGSAAGGDARAARSIDGLAHSLDPPPRKFQSASPGGTLRAHLGFALHERKSVPVFAEIGPGSNALLLGAAVDDLLVASLVSQMLRAGRKVVWLRQGRDEPSEAAGFTAPHLQAVEAVDQANLQWLRDLAAVPAVQAAARGTLLDLLPACLDPAAESCLASLVHRCAGDEIWGALVKKDARQLAHQAVRLVSDVARLEFRATSDLRRAANLVGFVLRTLSALQRALAMAWKLPPEGSQRVDLLLMDLLGKEPLPAALTGVLALGSLLHAVEMNGSISVEDRSAPEEFDLVVRKRPPREAPEQAKKVLEKLLSAARQRAGNPREEVRSLDDNPWLETAGLERGEQVDLVVLVSGLWGPEVEHIASWFQPGMLAERHALVLCLRSVRPELLRRRFLSLFRSFMVGELDGSSDLDAAARHRFEIGTCVALDRWQPAKPSPLESVVVRLAERRVASSPIVVWPEPIPAPGRP